MRLEICEIGSKLDLKSVRLEEHEFEECDIGRVQDWKRKEGGWRYSLFMVGEKYFFAIST